MMTLVEYATSLEGQLDELKRQHNRARIELVHKTLNIDSLERRLKSQERVLHNQWAMDEVMGFTSCCRKESDDG